MFMYDTGYMGKNSEHNVERHAHYVFLDTPSMDKKHIKSQLNLFQAVGDI